MQQAKHEVQQAKEKAKAEAAAVVAELQQNVSYLKRLVRVPACLYKMTESQHLYSNKAKLGSPRVAHVQNDKTRLIAPSASEWGRQSLGSPFAWCNIYILLLHLSLHELLSLLRISTLMSGRTACWADFFASFLST